MEKLYAILFVLLLQCISIINTTSCDCDWPKNYLETVDSYELIVFAEIVEHFELDRNGDHAQKTKIKVDEVLKGEASTDTLVYLNSNGMDCNGSLKWRMVGENFLLMVNYLEDLEDNQIDYVKSKVNVYSSVCYPGIIERKYGYLNIWKEKWYDSILNFFTKRSFSTRGKKKAYEKGFYNLDNKTLNKFYLKEEKFQEKLKLTENDSD